MSTDNVVGLPVWKRKASTAERFLELAQLARENPEQFEKMVIVYQETDPNGDFKVRYTTSGCSSIEALGLMDAGAYKIRRWVFENET